MEYSEHDKIPMQYLIIDVMPDHERLDLKNVGGASVSCWIRDQTKINAFYISKGWIEDQGWIIEGLDEQYPISADDYKTKLDGKQFYEQALIDEQVFVFHTFPNEQKI